MASKWRDRVNKILDAETERLKAKYREMEGNYRDTGYERYYRAMEKTEAELDELDTFRNSKMVLTMAESRSRRYSKVIGEYFKSMNAYADNHAGVERPVEETVRALKHRLEQALNEEGLL